MTPKNEKENQFRTKIFKALSDPIRLKILNFLRDGEKCVCEIIPHVALIQPVVSHHLKILKNTGLVKDRKDGNRRLYSVTEPQIFEIIDGVTPVLIKKYKERILEKALQK
jgi:ArsR family transcriptional regulator